MTMTMTMMDTSLRDLYLTHLFCNGLLYKFETIGLFENIMVKSCIIYRQHQFDTSIIFGAMQGLV